MKNAKIYDEIIKNINFISKPVKTCISRQTGEQTIFYDIDIEKMPNIELYWEFIGIYDKYNLLRGRSLNLSTYASFRQQIILYDSAIVYIIPALKEAYEKYVSENFYGKDIDLKGVKGKAFQLDWFNEVYVTDKKFKTSFQTKIEEIENSYRLKANIELPKDYALESWEMAWVDYVERYNINDYVFKCKDILKNHTKYPAIKDYIEYIKEAEKILHRKLR